MSSSSHFILELEGITKSFQQDFWSKRQLVLNNISISLKENTLVGFLGANGAGKTTLIKIILGLINADRGVIRYGLGDGTQRDFFRKLGHLPERPYLYADLSGHEFLNYMGKLQHLNKSEISLEVERFSQIFKLQHALQRPLRSYSKGMLQRVGFIAAVLHRPAFLLLDEPLSGLDPVGRKLFKEIMLGLHANGTTIFFTTHIVPDVEEICDQVVVLKNGSMLYQGTIENFHRTVSPNDAKDKHRITFYADDFWDTSQGGIIKHAQYKLGEKNVVEIILDVDKTKNFISTTSNIQLISVQPYRPNLESLIYQGES